MIGSRHPVADDVGRLAAFLKAVSIFALVDLDALRILARELEGRHYRRREAVFHEGDPGTTLYVIAKGSVKAYTSTSEGDDAVLAVLHPSDYFGELALLDGEPRTASVATLEETDVFVLQRTDFLRFVSEHAQAAESVLRSLAALVRRLNEHVVDALSLDLTTRLAKRFVQMADSYGSERPDQSIVIPLGLRQGELASMVGATRYSVNKVVTRFRSEGILGYDGRNYVIHQPERLRRLAGM